MWSRPQQDNTIQSWFDWLLEKKKDEKKRMEEEHQKLVGRMISGAEGRGDFFHSEELESFPLGPADVAGIITALT